MCHCLSQSCTVVNSAREVTFPRLKMQHACIDRPRILLCIAISVISLWNFVVESYLWIISLSVAVSVKAFEVILDSFCLSWARGITLVKSFLVSVTKNKWLWGLTVAPGVSMQETCLRPVVQYHIGVPLTLKPNWALLIYLLFLFLLLHPLSYAAFSNVHVVSRHNIYNTAR